MPNTPNNATDTISEDPHQQQQQQQHHQPHLPHHQYPPHHHPHLHPAALPPPPPSSHHLLQLHSPQQAPLGLSSTLRNGISTSTSGLTPATMGHTSLMHLPSLSPPNTNVSPLSNTTASSPSSSSTNNTSSATATTTATTTIPSGGGCLAGGNGGGGGGGAGLLNSGGGNLSTAVSCVSASPNTIGTGGAGARECAGCRKRITERFLLNALDLFWHEDCLKCGCCDCRLGEVGSTLYNRANLILCKRDYLRLFGATGYCAACNKVIPAFEMVMRAKSNVYHLECFACQQCNHRFCVGDRFYLCDNKILCEYDYEERLVFANMAYNPSSLAHIRRQVSSLQPAGDSMNCAAGLIGSSGRHHPAAASPGTPQQQHQQQQQQLMMGGAGVRPGHQSLNDKMPTIHQHHQHHQGPSNNAGGAAVGGGVANGGGHLRGDDGSSGYGSPDSETFETPVNQ